MSLGSSLSTTLGFLHPRSSFWLWRKELEETGNTGEESGEEVQGRKPPPAPLLPRQQKKLTTVNTMAIPCVGWCTHMGATPGHGQRFPEQEGGLKSLLETGHTRPTTLCS